MAYSARRPSISSDMMSTSAKSVASTLPHANPAPAYIGQSAASDLISSELDSNVVVSPPALTLVNEFLDQVLFMVLSTSRSVTLGLLRTAVPNVLKPRLGKAAVRIAEEELKEYLEDEEEMEMNTKRASVENRREFDVELAWKWARLRCMVYTRLGDLEEEDEEEWLEREQILEQVQASEKVRRADVEMGPASAIFLTTVIEYLGEQALYHAAQHAYKRHVHNRMLDHGKAEDGTPVLIPETDEIVLDAKDMNHVGRDSPLSRLWRSWRRNTRETSSRPMSPDDMLSLSMESPLHSRAGSQVQASMLANQMPSTIDQPDSPWQMPLPQNDNDIDEIEVPGLASALSESEDDTPTIPGRSKKRPASMVIMPGSFPGSSVIPDEYTGDNGERVDNHRYSARPTTSRKRSMSSPMPAKGTIPTFKVSANGIDEQLVVASDKEEQPRDVEDPTPSDIAMSPRDRSSVTITESSNKRAGIVGGAVAAAVGALGAGAAVATSSHGVEQAGEENSYSTIEPVTSLPSQKRTVAEEMLGIVATVPPPRDATTGASITNVDDFSSMHIPENMSPESLYLIKSGAAPAPIVPTVTGVAAASTSESRSMHGNALTHSQSAEQSAGLEQDSLSGRHSESQEKGVLRNSPTPTPFSGDDDQVVVHYRTTREPTREEVPSYSTTTRTPNYHDDPFTSSESQYNSRSDTSEFVINRIPASNTSTRQVAVVSGNPLRHAHADSQSSAYSNHSKSSSSSSRLLGFTRDAQGRPQTISQQRANGGMTEDTRAAHSSTPTSTSREVRPGTANSSTGKLLNSKTYKHGDEINEAKKKSLEVLIQSNETLHYTLTPATVMKDEESIIVPRNRTETQDMADFIRNTGPPGSERFAPSKPYMAPVSTQTFEKPGAPHLEAQQRSVPSMPNGAQTATSPARSRNIPGEPRDARTENSTSIRDLADFARSTGPKDATQLPRALSPRVLPTASIPNVTSPISKSASTSSSQPSSRSRFQPRDPRPSRHAEATDLIDFIREGPPRAPGDHRIDRRVAPFRTTMDSEDLNNLAPVTEKEPSVKISEASIHDRRIANGTASGFTNATRADSNARQPSAIDDNGMPKRTRTRVKDPYAIDYSDDEDLDSDLEVQRKPKNHEESLIDFLRNTAPPPGMSPQPILGVRPTNGKIPNAGQRAIESTRSNTARESSPHLTQTGSKIDKYRPTQATHAPHVEKSRSKPPRFEARDPTTSRSATSDLAEYLRSSGPATSSQSQPQPFILSNNKSALPPSATADKEGGLFRIFTKRKAK